jgi:hypothetical protein
MLEHKHYIGLMVLPYIEVIRIEGILVHNIQFLKILSIVAPFLVSSRLGIMA